MKSIRFTRRQFLKAMLAAMTGLAISAKKPTLQGMAQSGSPPIHLPLLMKSSGRGRPTWQGGPSLCPGCDGLGFQ